MAYKKIRIENEYACLLVADLFLSNEDILTLLINIYCKC